MRLQLRLCLGPHSWRSPRTPSRLERGHPSTDPTPFQRLDCPRTHNFWLRHWSVVGKNSGPIVSRLWAKIHEILGRCRPPTVVSNTSPRLSISCFVPKTLNVKVAVKLQIRRKTSKLGGFRSPILMGGYPQITTYIFKSHSLPNMW